MRKKRDPADMGVSNATLSADPLRWLAAHHGKSSSAWADARLPFVLPHRNRPQAAKRSSSYYHCFMVAAGEIGFTGFEYRPDSATKHASRVHTGAGLRQANVRWSGQEMGSSPERKPSFGLGCFFSCPVDPTSRPFSLAFQPNPNVPRSLNGPTADCRLAPWACAY